MHVTATSGPKLFSAEFARESLGVVVDSLDVSGNVGRTSERFRADITFVLKKENNSWEIERLYGFLKQFINVSNKYYFRTGLYSS